VPPVASLAWICSDTVSPSLLLWSPGLETRTCPAEADVVANTTQVKLCWALEAPSPAVTVVTKTPLELPALMVPEISPVVGLMLSPPGSPVAE
jgi:hypothetical protein